MTKSERRDVAKAAMAKAEGVRRRGQRVSIALSGLLAAGLIVAAIVVFRGANTEESTSATDNPSTAASEVAFPPLPEGADPALGTKPEAGPGEGELTTLSAKPLIEGKGATTMPGQTITVNYVGVSFKTGEEFDSSWQRSEPFSFTLGAGRVIKGWDQGLAGVKVGSRVQLDIPSDLAYGDDASGGAPTGPLRFVVDVLSVQ